MKSRDLYEDLSKREPYTSLWYVPACSNDVDHHAYYRRWYTEYESRCRVWYGADNCTAVFQECCRLSDKPLVPVLTDLPWQVGGGCFDVRNNQPFVRFPIQGANGYIVLHEFTHYLEFLKTGVQCFLDTYDGRPSHHSRLFKILLRQTLESFPDILDASQRFSRWAPNESVPGTQQ